jgi:hypothetical protein
VTLAELEETRPDRPSLKIGSAAPDFSAADLEGVSRKLAGYRGRMVLVEFWSTSCGLPGGSSADSGTEQRAGPRQDRIPGSEQRRVGSYAAEIPGEFKLTWPLVREPLSGQTAPYSIAIGSSVLQFIGSDVRGFFCPERRRRSQEPNNRITE